jgi:hypothetical protein
VTRSLKSGIVEPGATLHSNTQKQQQPHLPLVVQACPTSLEAHPATSTKSLQAPNVNTLSLNNMFKVVTMVFQRIMTELSGAESEEDRIVAITKIVSELMKQNGCK